MCHGRRCAAEWDVESAINTDTYNGSKAICSVACSQQSPTVVAFGASDRTLRVWDVRRRTSGEALAVKGYASHGGWIASVAWCPGSQHHSHRHRLP